VIPVRWKKGVSFLYSPPPPISLNCDDFPYQTDIQQVVGIHVAKYIRLVFNWI
jgi:hypothetical protein